MGILTLLLLLTIKRAVGLFGHDVDCGGSVRSDFCVSCPPSASGCGGDCVWEEERDLCIPDKGKHHHPSLLLVLQTLCQVLFLNSLV